MAQATVQKAPFTMQQPLKYQPKKYAFNNSRSNRASSSPIRAGAPLAKKSEPSRTKPKDIFAWINFLFSETNSSYDAALKRKIGLVLMILGLVFIILGLLM